jgi:hypothetical protein
MYSTAFIVSAILPLMALAQLPEPTKQMLSGCDVTLYKGIWYNIDSDILPASETNSFEDCVKICSTTSGCKAINFYSGVCVPYKNGISDPRTASWNSYYHASADHAYVSCPEPPPSAPVGCGKQAAQFLPSLTRRKTNRIIGGNEAKAHSWPWQIWMNCGASLIRVKPNVEESDIILTAAHCITERGSTVLEPHDSVTASAGSHRRDVFEAGEQTRRSILLRTHSDYDAPYIKNDIALVKLEKPIKFTDTIRPICLPTQGEALPVGKTCFVAGWGRISSSDAYQMSQPLKDLKVQVHAPETCKRKIVNGEWVGWSDYSYLEDQMVCAGSLDATSNVCNGDSGGMLACQTQPGGGWTLYGIASFVANSQCLEKGKPGIFTRVSKYVDWINKNAAEMTSVR